MAKQNIFLRNKTFLFFKIESWKFQFLFEIWLLFSFFLLVFWLSWHFLRFHEILFEQMLKISVFYLIKQKSFIPKKYNLGSSQYQNKKALFTDPIFSNGFGFQQWPYMHCICHYKGQKWNIGIHFSWSDATLPFTYSNISATPWSSKTGLFIARTHNNFTGTTQRIQMDFIDFPNWVPRLFLTKCATKYIKL